MKILPNWNHCVSQLLSYLYNHYYYYYSMYIRLLYNLIFNYYYHDYAINYAKRIRFVSESGSNTHFAVTITYNKKTKTKLKIDICFMNTEGIQKTNKQENKTFCPTFNQFIGTFEYKQVIGLITLVKIQIILTGQHMPSNTLAYFCNAILSYWHCISEVLSVLYNYYLFSYYYNVYLWFVCKSLSNYYCYYYAFYCTKHSEAVQKSDRNNYIFGYINEEKDTNPDICLINVRDCSMKMFNFTGNKIHATLNKFIVKSDFMQLTLTLVKIQIILLCYILCLLSTYYRLLLIKMLFEWHCTSKLLSFFFI